MSTASTTYYNLVRVREMGPEASDWAVTDSNFEAISLILKSFEQHSHTGATGIPAPTVAPTLTVYNSGGVLSPGTTVGVRISYVNAMGLETDATSEIDVTLPTPIDSPLTPIWVSTDPFDGGLTGGTYSYGMTKTSNGGETEISDILPIAVPYDQTYSVTLSFDSVSTLADGTTGYNVYRSAGLNSSFQLVGQVSDTTVTTFTDTNTSVDQTAQPPTVSTFDNVYRVNIDWSTLTLPVGTSSLKVYVTQQTSVFSIQSLLVTEDMTASPAPTNIDYLGSETLNPGSPLDATQIPSQPQQINLATEATGGFVLTTNGDFGGHQALNLVLQNSSAAPASPHEGQMYYDTSINNARAYINGVWTNWGTTSGSTYTHPAEEVGGHLATNIRWITGSSTPNLGTLLSTFFDAISGSRKQATKIQLQTGPSSPATINTTTPTVVDHIIVGAPEFDQQYYIVTWQGNMSVTGSSGKYITLVLAINGGSNIPGTSKNFSLQSTATSTWFPFYISVPVQIPIGTEQINAVWNTSASGITGSLATNAYTLTARSLV